MSITTDVVVGANTRIVRLQGGGLRFLDAHEIPDHDFRVITRPLRGVDTTQHWRMTDIGDGVSTIAQISSGRFLDARPDFTVVTRPQRDDDAQRWRIQDFGGGFIAIQQVSTDRFLEATLAGDFNVVTRPSIDNEQTWRVGAP
jgi:hypothetical protein